MVLSNRVSSAWTIAWPSEGLEGMEQLSFESSRRSGEEEERVIRADHYRTWCKWTGHESRKRYMSEVESKSTVPNDDWTEVENLSFPRNNRARKIFVSPRRRNCSDRPPLPDLDFDRSTETRIGQASLPLPLLLLFSQSRCYCFLRGPFCSFSNQDSFEPSFFLTPPLPLSFFLSTSPTEERKTGIPRSF